MLDIFISSKDRSSQLRLLLESIDRNFGNIEDYRFHIRLTYTNDLYKLGYEKLKRDPILRRLSIAWVEEPDFIKDFYSFLDSGSCYACFFTDDCIFYRSIPYKIDSLCGLLTKDVWCLSLRLGLNSVIQDYKSGFKQEAIHEVAKRESSLFIIRDGIVYYNYKKHRSDTNYGLPFSWDGVLYDKDTLLQLFQKNDFKQTDNQWSIPPQWIENWVMNHRDKISQDIMCCLIESAVVCMNWNSTHPYAKDTIRFDASKETLCRRYLDGHVIDLNSIDFSNILSTHGELSFEYR